MMMKNILLILTLSILFLSCDSTQSNADKLRGTWKISSIIGDSTIISPDSIQQYLIFEPCENAYTATCKVKYVFEDTSVSTQDTLMANITIKQDDIRFFDQNIPYSSGTSNFNKLFKLQRYLILKIQDNQLHLQRYSDSLTIEGIKQ